MKFFDTLVRLGLGRPITDVYESICNAVDKKVRLGHDVIEVRLHPAWYHELLCSLSIESRFTAGHYSVHKGVQQLKLCVCGCTCPIVPDINAGFMELVVDPANVEYSEWVQQI